MKEKYISRVDSYKSSMFGYLLRLYRNKGVLFQQWFPDKDYGGKEKALTAAKRIRDRKMVEYNYQPGGNNAQRFWKPVQMNASPRSNTGRLGVYESREFKTLRDGSKKECRYIAASYVEEKGKPKTKKFYYGTKRTREEALKLAENFRSSKEISARAAAVDYNRKLQKKIIEEENEFNRRLKRINEKNK